MDKKTKEYNERYYTKKAIQYLKENGIELNEHSIRRAVNYFRTKSVREEYKQRRAKYMDDSFMQFVDEFESEVYCSASL